MFSPMGRAHSGKGRMQQTPSGKVLPASHFIFTFILSLSFLSALPPVLGTEPRASHMRQALYRNQVTSQPSFFILEETSLS